MSEHRGFLTATITPLPLVPDPGGNGYLTATITPLLLVPDPGGNG